MLANNVTLRAGWLVTPDFELRRTPERARECNNLVSLKEAKKSAAEKLSRGEPQQQGHKTTFSSSG